MEHNNRFAAALIDIMILEAIQIQIVGSKRIQVVKTLTVDGFSVHFSDRFVGLVGLERLDRC